MKFNKEFREVLDNPSKFLEGAEKYDINKLVNKELEKDPDFERRSQAKRDRDWGKLANMVVGSEGDLD